MLNVRRRDKRNRRSVFVRFQPWLIGGGILLNVVASGSAALSAFYTSQQAELATSAVDQQSKNQAFSNFIKAKEDLCKVSLTQWDQMDGLLDLGQKLSDGGNDIPIWFVDYEAIMEGHSVERTIAYARKANQLSPIVRSELTQLSIWLPREQYWFLASMAGDGDDTGYSEDYLLSSGQMAEFTAVETQYQCRRDVETAIIFYTGISLEEGSANKGGGIRIAPLSQTKTIEEIVNSWGVGGQSNLFMEALERNGVFEWDRKRLERNITQ